ncbi:MAG: ComEA family DNA-binding protein [Oscillospiraceae bacterium]|nr:ComEA family DNA-binding protein [Oscillospiraceae bacterium]
MKKFKQNLPFILTMAAFTTACAVLSVLAIRNEPQYVRLVPSSTSVSDASDTIDTPATAEESPPLNINTATAEELQTLPGIGASRAADIIAYREANGGFLYIEELLQISGIGDKTFENLRELVCVE